MSELLLFRDQNSAIAFWVRCRDAQGTILHWTISNNRLKSWISDAGRCAPPCRQNFKFSLKRGQRVAACEGAGADLAKAGTGRPRSDQRCSTTYNAGTNRTAMQVDASMPLNTVMPIDLRAAAPAPVANTRGSTPRMKAIDVITMGRKRFRAA